jgi:hypothetical protein
LDRSRRVSFGVFVAVAALLLNACSPSLNWRETRIADTGLTAMMPCKPAHHQRSVPLAGLTVTMQMTACDADGATFAIAHADIPDSSAAPQILAQWRTTTLANIAADVSSLKTVNASPTAALPGSLRVIAQGKRGDASPVRLHGIWFAQGSRVFHAAVYAPQITSDMAETFFSGLKFQ